MAATVQLNQYYGSSAGTKNAGVARNDFLSADVAQTSDLRATYPITVPGAGTNYSYELWQKLEVTAMGGSTKVDTIRHYSSGAPGTGLAISTSANSGTPSNPAGATPVNTNSALATTSMPTSDPGVATISGTLTTTGESGYVVSQCDVGTTATAGFELTFTFRYAEVA